MKLKINVTKEHIRAGIRVSFKSCPIALALRESGVVNATAEHGGFGIKNPRHPMPKKVRRFIYAFDRAMPVKPFSFTVNVRKIK